MLKFYHAPWSRGSGVLWLLEELGAEYELVHIDIRAEGGVPESYRAVQPNKKVPAIEHDGVVVTERAAICIYLADTFSEAGLAPAISDRMRAPYLTSLVYCDAVLDPAVAAHGQGYSYPSNNFSFGLFDDMVRNVEKILSERPYAAGDRFTAADTQFASAINYTMNVVKILPERPIFRAYVERVEDRAAARRARELDQALAMQTPFFRKQFGQG